MSTCGTGKDPERKTVQIVRISRSGGRRSRVYNVAAQMLVRLGDDDMRAATPTPNGKWAIGRNDVAYRGTVEWGANRADMYRVNTETGERTLIEKTLSRTMGTSPDSKWFLYLKDKKVRAVQPRDREDRGYRRRTGKEFPERR